MRDPEAECSTLKELLRSRALRDGSRRAYTFLPDGEGQPVHVSYGELDRQARAIAAELGELAARGERALLLYPAGLDYVAAFFGCLYAGTTAVPAYPPRGHRPSPRIRTIVADAGATVALTTRAVLAKLERRIRDLPDLGSLRWRATDEIDLARAEDWNEPRISSDTLAFLQYTSGSTAAPKGVMVSHGNLLHNEELIKRACEHTSETPCVSWLPLYHDLGLIGNLLQSLYVGAPCTLMSPVAFLQRPIRWLEAISRYGAHTSGGPNFAYDLCVRKIAPEEREGLDLSSWKVAFNGAEPVRSETLDRFAKAFAPHGFRREAFYPCYGMAETTLIVSGGRRSEQPVVRSFDAAELERHRAAAAEGSGKARALVGCGKALCDLDVVIADPESGLRRGPGEVGEIWVSGPSVCQGYWNRCEETAATFGATLAPGGEGPYLRTGDLGFLDGGELFITGRLKDLIIVRGQNHYPQDVEATVERCHPALRPGGGAAFSLEPEGGGEERLVVVQEISRQHRRPDVEEIAGAARRALSEDHELALHALVLIQQGSLPKTSSGKVQRRKCRQEFLEGRLSVVGEWREAAGTARSEEAAVAAASGEVAGWLTERLAARLGVAPGDVDPGRSIVHYGLDSLAAIELAHEIEVRFGVSLGLEELFEAASLTELAEQLAPRAVEPGAGPPAAAEVGPPAERRSEAPLSQGQRALWFLHQLDPASPAYNIASAVRVHGEIDVAALRRAFQTLVDRHAALRTSFTLVAGEPVQRIHESFEVSFTEEEVADGQELDRRLNELALRPFDLEHLPLVRVTLVRCGPEEKVLLVSAHHVVCDFWSLAVLMHELGEAYRGAREGRPAQLAPLAREYADWVDQECEMLDGPVGGKLASYWRGELEGELPTLELPADRHRPPVLSSEGGALGLRLETEAADGLERVGRQHGATLFVTLLSCFQLLLHRVTGQRRVLVGSPTAGRRDGSLAGLVGYFVNPVVLSSELAGDLRFTSLLEASRRKVLGAFEHQDYPFAKLVSEIHPVRDPSRSPIFQAMFALQTAPRLGSADLSAFALGSSGARVRFGDLTFEAKALEQRIAQFDVTLSMGKADGALAGLLDYSRDLFDRTTAERLARSLVTLLAAVANDPEQLVSELALLSFPERQQLLVEWNDTEAPAPAEGCVYELFEVAAERHPEALALTYDGESLTYGDLRRQSSRLARRLMDLGVGPEVPVGLCLERSLAMIVSIFGILKAGGAWVPLDPAYPEERLAWTLADAGVRAVVTRRDLAGRLSAHLPRGSEVVVTDDPEPAAGGEDAEAPICRASCRAGRGNAACVIYTSGSTGRPKGVVIEHRNLLRMVSSFHASYRPEVRDRILPVTAITSASFVGEFLPLLSAGGAVVLPTTEQLLDFTAMIELMARWEVSILSTVPTVIAGLESLKDRMPKLRLILSGGEALPPGEVEAFLGEVTVVNSYGLTETTVCSTIHSLEAADMKPDREVPIGRPLAGQQLYILDTRLRSQPVGCPGEIFLGGEGVARGYLAAPAQTADRFVPNPLSLGGRIYRTGDWGRWTAGGRVEFLGRSDQQVQIRGFRIELGEVESVLDWHPAVRQSAVVVHRDASGDARLAAYVVFQEGRSVPAGEVLAYLRKRLPYYMVPAAVIPLETLPLLTNGKVDLKALPVPGELRPELATAYEAPLSELERRIAEAFQEALGLGKVGLHDNFFDLGGHSLLLSRVHAKLRETVAARLSLIDLYRFPTVGALASYLGEGERAEESPRWQESPRETGPHEGEIAVVGMGGRFPGAKNPGELWQNLVRGIESIVTFTDEELEAAGIDPEHVHHPNYVKAKGILGDIDLFDAQFFGHNPRVAELMDPQHRVFLECAWEALEDAGYDAERYPGRIGVFAGQSMNTYWLVNLYHHVDLVASVDSLEAAIGNDKDSLTTEVSYRMNLKGPSVNVQSSSSTSLTAIHYACRSLLHGECEMALSGGVSIHVPEISGYFHHEGGTTSPDGHCRTFDAGAKGFVSGHGAGVVVLKRLGDALRDGDSIYAVIKGSACNNDGSFKVSYMAPSVDGHAEVVARAQAAAGVSAASIGYVEAHGTGTLMGDPIEVAALTQAFRASTEEQRFCALGSVKTNIGHLDTASGVAGLIKVALCLRHRQIPAILHFEEPNPKIDFETSPFFVNDRLRPFERRGDAPRRAGVSSLGMGGTNTHVVLEEAPETEPSGPSRPWQLVTLSAKTAPALEQATARLAENLRQEGPALADVAYTLRVGRKQLPFRRIVVARDREDAAEVLESLDAERAATGFREEGRRGVVFLASGQGSQYVGMGRELYESEPVFRQGIDRAAEHLRTSSGAFRGRDLRELIWAEESEEAARALEQTAVAQPALFAVEHALAELWASWGVEPQAMIGHSIGEYVAAALAGVMDPEDALTLVALRGSLMQSMPPGVMLAVPLAEEETVPLLGESLALAAVNRPGTSVVSGPEEAIARLEAVLAERGVEGRRLHTSHAFHSPMMDPILAPFREAVAKVELRAPRIPYLSNVTGTWIRPEEATDPDYWARQLRGTVRFADGVAELAREPNRIFLEIGPGHALATSVRQHPARATGQLTLPTLRHPRERRSDSAFLLYTLGRLWLAGVEVDEEGFYRGERRRRVSLPTYPFERRRYWVEPGKPAGGKVRPAVSPHVDDWFWVPSWKQTPTPEGVRPVANGKPWMVFSNPGSSLPERLRSIGQEVVTVTPGASFVPNGGTSYEIRPNSPEDYEALFDAVGSAPGKILHLWSLGQDEVLANGKVLERGFESLLCLARACGSRGPDPVDVVVVSDQLQDVTGEEPLDPAKATLLGPCRVMNREYPHVTCRSIDVAPGREERILDEIALESKDPVVAWRGTRRWVQTFEPVRLDSRARLRQGGVYLVTGGLGGLGLEVVEYLARTVRARLVLVGRSPLPARGDWDDWLSRHGEGDPSSRKIRRLLALEELGAEVLAASADVADAKAMAALVAEAEGRFGPIHGIVHAAGVPGGELLDRKTHESARAVLAPKVEGTLVLDEIFRGRELDFWVLFSSTTSILAELGQADYAAANAFLDAFAHERTTRRGSFTTAVNWDAWRDVGMAASTPVPVQLEAWNRERLARGLDTRQGVAAFERVLGASYPQVVVSREDFPARVLRQAALSLLEQLDQVSSADAGGHARPDLANAYVAPESELEKQLAAIWQEHLGLGEVGVSDNFFELGGNSLIGLKVAARIRSELGCEVSPVTLFEGPTIRSLAGLLAPEGQEEPVAAGAGESRGARRRARRSQRRSGR